jgi:SAM-dependent methyltransferase
LVVSIWRPRPPETVAAVAAARVAALEPPLARATDPLYPSRARAEAEYWAGRQFEGWIFKLSDAWERMANAAFTGRADRLWLDDLADRGPFGRAAALGCDEGGFERRWLERGASEHLDVYELSPGVIRKVRAHLGLGWTARLGRHRRIRFTRADLNFVRLPAAAYDVVWSSGCLHHVMNLERLFAEVEQALRPGGLFAIRDYVGERRLQYAPARLARVNQLLHEVPARYRRTEMMAAPPLYELSPFCGVRSDDVIRLAEARFDVVHKAMIGALFPLYLGIDLGAIEREAPEVLRQVQAAEHAAQRDGIPPAAAYLVLRKRS